MKKKSVWWIFPLIHLVLSFFYERMLFAFSDNFRINRLTPINLRFSDSFEIIMAYSISKMIGAVLIFCIWKLIFSLKKYFSLCEGILFVTFFILGAIILLFYFPDSFITSNDNFITYADAVNFVPGYWHSLYTSCFYAGCMMVFPHAYAVVFFHWLGLIYTIGYMYVRVKRSTSIPKYFRFLSFFILMFPIVHTIMMDVYRTELYCILFILYFEIIMLDILEKRKRSIKESLIIIFLASVLSVWRNEGIIFATISYCTLLIFVYRDTVKRNVYRFLLFLGAVVVLMMPQKIGDIKYYGNDYSITNLSNPLGAIFNDPNADLSYENADKDVEAIETFIPVVYLQEFYLDGLRRRNYAIGSRDINQSMSALNYSNEFVKAAYRIILHNPKTYLKKQWNYLNYAFGTSFFCQLDEYAGEFVPAIEWEYDLWDVGEEIFYESEFTKAWSENEFRLSVKRRLDIFRNGYFNLVYPINAYINIACVVFLAIITICEIVVFCRKKRSYDGVLGIVIALILQYTGIFLVMPGGVPAYFRSVFMATYVLAATIPIVWVVRRQEKERKAKVSMDDMA